MTTETPPTCPKCGADIPESSISGECVSCLIGLAFIEEDTTPERSFGNYRLLESIGRGGMGIVYRALQENLDRTVALKMIVGGELATPESLRRFQVETESAANLDHPNIVPIYDVGEVDELPYYTMRLIDGGSLADVIADFVPGENSSGDQEEKIGRFLSKVARTVAFAHDHGILHRDIKPTNLLMDREGEPLLSDFGLAKRMQDEDAAITLSSSALGSPSYMAPEQSTGDSTIASDIWSLGAILYEMLTGEPPFRGKTAMETLRLAIEETPESPRKRNPKVSRDLETICLKCLEKEPSKRYSSPGALAGDLDRFVRGEPVLARPVSGAGMVYRWCRRNPVPATLSIALLMAVFVGMAGIASQWIRAEKANVELSDSVRHLEWRRLRSLVEQDRPGHALAELAGRLRKDPDDLISAYYALSLLREKNFALPVGESFSEPEGTRLLDLSWGKQGKWIASHTGGTEVVIRDGFSGESITEFSLGNSIEALAAGPSEEVFVVGLENGTLWLLDASRNKKEQFQNPAPGVVRELLSLPESDFFVVATDSGIFELDFATDTTPRELLKTRGETIRTVKLSGDGSRFLCETESEVILFDRENRAELNRVPHVGRRTGKIDLSSNGSVFVTLDREGLKIYDDTNPNPVATISRTGYFYPTAFAISPDGSRIVTGTGDGTVEHWAVPSGRALVTSDLHESFVNSFDYLSDGRSFFTSAQDNSARIWDADSGEPISETIPHANYVEWSCPLGPPDDSGQRFLTAESGMDRKFRYRIWKVPPPVSSTTLARREPTGFDAVSLSPDGKRALFAATKVGLVQVDTSTMKRVATLSRQERIMTLHHTPDSQRLFVTFFRGELVELDADGNTVAVGKYQSLKNISTSDLDASGERMILGTTSGQLGVWDVSVQGKPTEVWRGEHDAYVSSAVFSRDGDRALTTSNDSTAIVWDAETGEQLVRYHGHSQKILHGGISPDGTKVATASYDLSAHVWDASTGELLFDPILHSNQVLHATFSADGRLLATGARDGKIELWDTDRGERLFGYLQENGGIRWLGFSPDGSRLISFSYKGTRQWDVATGEPITSIRTQRGVESIGFKGDFTTAHLPGTEMLLTGAKSLEVVLHDLSLPEGPPPPWFADCLEVIVMKQIGDDGIRSLPFDEASRLLRRISENKENDEWSVAIRAALGVSNQSR